MDREKLLEAVGTAAHEANRAYQVATGEDPAPHWEDWPEPRREGVRRGIARVLAGETPRELHEAWLRDMVAAGWRVGPKKDESKKEHPCIVPYDQLPPGQKLKDDLFLAVVRAVSGVLGGV